MDNNGGWHLDKRLSWGHVLTTLGLVVSAIFMFTDLGTRVEINSNEIDHNADRIERVEDNISRQYEEIKSLLIRLEDKLDAHEARS